MPATYPRILVVEDDRTLSDQITRLLHSRGYQVSQCFEGEQALRSALTQRQDLILLDVVLPAMSGFDVLERLRRSRQTPVMMLTACGAEEERILGYQQGADDYVPKPFSFTELLLRIEALLRRTMNPRDTRAVPTELRVDDLVLNRSALSVHFGEQPVALTQIQFRLLWMLLTHRNETLSKPFLYQTVLERDYSRYDRSLDMHLSRVRRKLMAAGMAADRLQTVHGQGYCFL